MATFDRGRLVRLANRLDGDETDIVTSAFPSFLAGGDDFEFSDSSVFGEGTIGNLAVQVSITAAAAIAASERPPQDYPAQAYAALAVPPATADIAIYRESEMLYSRVEDDVEYEASAIVGAWVAFDFAWFEPTATIIIDGGDVPGATGYFFEVLREMFDLDPFGV